MARAKAHIIAPDSQIARNYAQIAQVFPYWVNNKIHIMTLARGTEVILLLGDVDRIYVYDEAGWEIRREAANRQALGIITVMGVWM